MKKRKVVVSAIMTIILCVSIIAGSTMALFTSESSVNIAITSGKVDVLASVAVTEVYSPTAIASDGTISNADNAANTKTNTFANGGYCVVDGSKLTIANITPGDKVSFTITVQNNSTVATVYRYGYKVVATDGRTIAEAYTLYTGLNFVFGTTTTANVVAYRTAWAPLTDNVTVDGSIQLPTTANNDFAGLGATIVFTVEAAQGNIDTTSTEEITQLVASTTQVEDLLQNAQENETITIASTAPVGISNITTNGLTLSGVSQDATTIKTSATVISAKDVTISNATVKGYGSSGTTGNLNISGNNATIDNVAFVGNGNGINIAVSTGAANEGTVIKNSSIKNGFRGIQFWNLSGKTVIDNCVIDHTVYTFNVDAVTAGATLEVTNSTLNGWTSYTEGIDMVSFTNCSLGKSNGYSYLRPYSNTILTDCEFTVDGYQLNAGGSKTYTITITNCTKNGVAITADNVVSLLLDLDDWNYNVTLIVDGTVVTVA